MHTLMRQPILNFCNILLILGTWTVHTGVDGKTVGVATQTNKLFESGGFLPGEFSQISTRQHKVPSEQIAALTNDDLPDELKDEKHGIKMGIPWRDCDDGNSDLYMDWDEDEADYTCYGEKNWPILQTNVTTEVCIEVPHYMAKHFCMFTPLKYNDVMPFYGDHRPLWPVYGEYEYLPPQRWLHALEHGTIAFFYHPCANRKLVKKIRTILKHCMRKYIIAKHTFLEESAPFLLMSWGCKKFMSGVDAVEIVRFIRDRAMKAPESLNLGQGWYDKKLLVESKAPPKGTDIYESHLCPRYPKVLSQFNGTLIDVS